MNEGRIIIDLKPCPWCKKTPSIDLICDEGQVNEVWQWTISCKTLKCMVNPKTKPIFIHSHEKGVGGIMLTGILKLVDYWNTKNPTKFTDPVIVDLLQIITHKKHDTKTKRDRSL